MTRITPLLLLLALAGCALPAPEPRATAQEMHTAQAGYTNCLRAKLPRYEDSLFGAATIGTAMIGLCEREYDFLYHHMIKGMAKLDRKELNLRREQVQAEMATDLVTQERKKDRNSK